MTKSLATDGEGERLDRFELIAELASGGMATVYLARLSGVAGFQRLVAIKRLHPHLAKEPEFVEMFLDEARLAARIHHPNVVPIQEVGQSERGYYLVMDYVEGDTLARLLARSAQAKKPVPWGVTIRILLDTLAGLHTAHELKDDMGQPLLIVHRDVSPQNILVGVDGIARITDFGVARAASRLSTTRSGQLKGKLAYMAPEQARGSQVDRRADIFSVGIVLWEALAMKRLFKGDGEAETLNRVLYDPIAPPSSVRPDVPKGLDTVCMKALAREQGDRYASCQDFADALEKAARTIDSVGSVRDVASCLEEVVGTDLTQQRETVRAWLVRSEPSAARNSGVPLSRPNAVDSVQTRVEGRGDSSASRRPGLPVDRGAVTAPAPFELGMPSSAPPEKVSSVSSAVLMVGSSVTAPQPIVQPRSNARLFVLAFVAIAAIVVLGAGAFGASRYAANRASPANPALTPATPAPPPPSAVPTVEPPKTAAAASEAPPPPAASASASASAKPIATARGTWRPGGGKPRGTGTPAGTPAGTTKAPSDDLSRNPYR